MTETTTTTGPECYVRINISKTSKGYSHETTVSVRWTNMTDLDESHLTSEQPFVVRQADASGDEVTQEVGAFLADLNRLADHTAREEIARREAEDSGGDR